MPEQTANRRSGFFHRVITSANSGLPSEPGKTDAFRSTDHLTEPSAWFAIDSGLVMKNDSLTGCNTDVAALTYISNRRFEGSSANRQKAWHREEGPLSGVAPGSNESVDHFGESTISRFDPKAVGSASKSSYDTHVNGIEHTEVDHASGYIVPSSSVRIESGVSKTPESNQVLLSGSKVERYAEAKDRRQQAASSNSYLDRSNGQNGQDDDRAGLPPAYLPAGKHAGDSTSRDAAALPPAPQSNGFEDQPPAPIRYQRYEDKKSARGNVLDPPADDGAFEDSYSISRGPADETLNTGHRIGNQLTDSTNVFSRTADDPGHAMAPDIGGRHRQIKPKNQPQFNLPQKSMHHRPHREITPTHQTGSTPDNFDVNKATAGQQGHKFNENNLLEVHAANEIPEFTAKQYPNSDDTPQAKALAGAAFHLSRPIQPLQNPFGVHQQMPPAAKHVEPQVQIGQIDVIVDAPQATQPSVQPSTSSSSNMASRYYLKGL